MWFRELDFSGQSISLALGEVKDMFQMHFAQGCRHVMQRVYEKALALDFARFINAGRYERTDRRRSQRNGYRSRSLLTAVGNLELRVPRDRAGQFHPTVFARHERIHRGLAEVIRSLFLHGVSTRKVGEVLAALCGESVSASTVSTLTRVLDQAVREFANAPIVDHFLFLVLDAVSVRIRFGLRAKRVLVLVAYGIRANGSRALIGFRRAKSESAACWTAFLENLRVRGLRGRHLKLITLDGGTGLWAAVEEVFPLIPHQLCWVHKLRNVAGYCPRKHQPACVAGAREIMNAPSLGIAVRRFRAWKQRWGDVVPKAVRCLERDFDQLIPIFEFPEDIRRTIRSTNVIERSFRELRRRLKVMGYFQNSASCDRLVFAVFSMCNARWAQPRTQIKTIKTYYHHAA